MCVVEVVSSLSPDTAPNPPDDAISELLHGSSLLVRWEIRMPQSLGKLRGVYFLVKPIQECANLSIPDCDVLHSSPHGLCTTESQQPIVGRRQSGRFRIFRLP